MPIPFDLDLPYFLWTISKVIFSSKDRLRKNAKPIPLRFEYEELSESQLTPAQREYMKPFDDQFAKLNYRPQYTFRANNFGSNLLRRYIHPTDTATGALTIIEVKANVNGVENVRNVFALEFATRLANGNMFLTFNKPQPSLLDSPPFRITQDFPNVSNLAELKKLHDAKGRTLGPANTPPQDFPSVCNQLNGEHERNAKFQLERGIYQLSPGGDAYFVTDKVFDRGIRNHFLPFGKRISPVHAILSALIGAVFSLLGVLKVAPWLASQPALAAGGSVFVPHLGILLCYSIAGFLIGYICEYQKLTWIMLVTYLPAHLVAGWTFGWFPYSTAAFLCAYMASQSRQRAKLVLQS
ncbi:MAG TPA: hypothetical protein VN025_10875 [Candidatus Dormibacteraeota bacterium]|nr:hypothetical protein [Candidatus Dormibacteraeota bacterium]